ncbi:MAG: hypothetical protein ACRDBO_04520 [Lachnospiraceae bacterium]
MRAKPIKLTALTEEEQQYAAEHYEVLSWCMRVLRVPDDDSGVAALGYLQAVKKWIARPELHHRSFRTIALWAVKARMQNERKREGRQIKTVSLEAVIPGTEDLTFGDTITYENMDYLYQRRENKVTVEVKYDVKIPEAARLGRTPCVEIEMLMDFLGSSHKTMAFNYDEAKTAGSKAYTIRAWVKKSNRKDINVYKYGTDIYIEKVPARKKGDKSV